MRFTLLSVFLASCAITVVCSVVNVYSHVYGLEPSLGTLLVSTFVSGMALVASGSIYLGFREQSIVGQKLVRMGGILMASVPIGFAVIWALSLVLH